MSSQVNSIAIVGKRGAAKCERCYKERKKCVKGVVGMTGCKRCTFLGHECSQSAEAIAQPSEHPITVRTDVSATSNPAGLQKQLRKIESKYRRASLESVSSEDEKDVLQNKTKNSVIEHVTTSKIVPETDTASKETTSKESMDKGLQQVTESSKREIAAEKRAQAKQERATKLQDLRRFSQYFSVKSPLPSDIVSILAKDPEKQQAIVDKAKRQYEESKASAVTPPQAASDPRATSIDTPVQPIFQPSKKSAAIFIKNSAGEVVELTKGSSSKPDGAARSKDNDGTSHNESQPKTFASVVGSGSPDVSSSVTSTTNYPATPECSTNWLRVDGIDVKVTEDTLRKIFETVGRTILVQIFKGPNPRTKGFAHIAYDDSATAARAKALLNGRKVHGTMIRIELLNDSIAGSEGSESSDGRTTHTPPPRPDPPTSQSKGQTFTPYMSNHAKFPSMASYTPMRSAWDSLPYQPPSQTPNLWYLTAQRLNTLFTLEGLKVNQLLRRNIDFDGYISISVLVQYRIQLGLPATVDHFAIGFAAQYYCSTIECGAAPVMRCCLKPRYVAAALLVEYGQMKLEFPCRDRGKHVRLMSYYSSQYANYSLPPPISPYAAYGSSSYTPMYTYPPGYSAYGQMYPSSGSLYPPPMSSSMNFASHNTTSRGHSYGQTNLYNDATAVLGDIYHTHNYYSQNIPQAANTSADHQEQFIEQVLSAAAKFGISTPQVPTVKSKHEVSRWIRDVYEAQLEASTVWGGQMSIVPPTNATSLEPLDLATEYGSSRPASPRTGLG